MSSSNSEGAENVATRQGQWSAPTSPLLRVQDDVRWEARPLLLRSLPHESFPCSQSREEQEVRRGPEPIAIYSDQSMIAECGLLLID
jgi:hypothetical protein